MPRPDARELRESARAALGAVEEELTSYARGARLVAEVQRQRSELQHQRAKLTAANAQLDIERHRYAELFDFAPIGYLNLDGTGIIRSTNLAAALLLGRERRRLVGAPLLACMVADDRRRLLEHLRCCRQAFGVHTIDLAVQRPDGPPTPVQLLSKRGGIGPEGEAILTVMVDMTEREQAFADRRRSAAERDRMERESELARSASDAKDRFLAVLSHELRNPLSPILYTVETLERGMVPPDRVPDALALIRRNLDLEVRLIDDLLDVSRIVHGKLTLERRLMDLHDVAHDVVDGAARDLRNAELRLSVELRATRSHLNGDANRLRQVIWNLVSNAIRNTPPGGQVALRTRDFEDCIVVQVQDTGRGLAPNRLETIFEPFDQVDPVGRRRGGLGLGLAISRGLVEAHAGRISAASEGLDRGATFTVVLPTMEDETERSERPAEKLAPPARGLRILVVEDDADSAESLAMVLTVRGHEVVTAHSVAEGVACGEQEFDVLVSDIGLPDGSGIDVMAALRQRGRVRGVAISGFGTPEDVQHSIAAGFERHLTKPVHLDLLIEIVELLGG